MLKSSDLPLDAREQPDEWSIEFDKTKAGKPCPVVDLGNLSLQQVVKDASNSDEPVPAKFETEQNLFVGYLPRSNFAKTLDTGAGIEVIASELLDRIGSVSHTSQSDAQLNAIRQEVGAANTTVLYFDDNSFGCEDYPHNLQESKLNQSKAIIVAAKEDYPPGNGRRLSSGFVEVCEENELLRVYIFDSREVYLSRAWRKVLDSVFEDLKGWL